MIRTLVIFGVVGLALPAAAQRRGEVTADQCADHRDNDGNGLTDCDDPGCRGFGFCESVPLIELDGEKKLTPQGQMLAGALMLVMGPAVAGASAAVYLDAAEQRGSKQILEYAVAGVLTAAGAAITIGGGTFLRRGVVKHREDVEMGLALGPGRLSLRVVF